MKYSNNLMSASVLGACFPSTVVAETGFQQNFDSKHTLISSESGSQGALTICTEISVKNFRQMVLVFFWHRKQERD